jgi:hypothetical protein
MTDALEFIRRIDNWEKPPDYLFRVGEEHYKWPGEFTDEAKIAGPSKRIPKEVGTDYVPLQSRMGFVHARAQVTVHADGMALHDLALKLWMEHMSEIGQTPDADLFDPVALELLDEESGRSRAKLIRLLQWVDGRKELKRLQEKYKLEFHDGTFLWSLITSKQYVMPADSEEVPQEVIDAHAEPVYDEYIEEAQ